MKKSTKSMVTTITIMAILAGFIIWYFFNLTNNIKEPKEEINKTEAQKLIDKDIAGTYPQTPKEVLKLYGRITQCLYNDEMSEDEFVALGDQLRELYDEELLDENPKDSYMANLAADVNSYRIAQTVIASYDVQSASGTDTQIIEGREYATLRLTILIRQDGKYKQFGKSQEQFLLRRDENKKWKILHWKLLNNDSVEE